MIYSHQTEFVKGRYIEQNVRLLEGILENTDIKKLPGIVLFMDFEKAFDTIEWSFIQNVLRRFNFGQDIRKRISVLYSDVESAVLNGGYSTNYFKVSRGVRQGCPLSPLSFVLGVDRGNGLKLKAVPGMPRKKITAITAWKPKLVSLQMIPLSSVVILMRSKKA